MQLTLDFSSARSIQERFEAFDEANPAVFRMLVELAEQARSSGAKRIGMKCLWEVLRWHIFIATRDVTAFKLNNIYTSRYARKLLAERPEFEGVIEVRELRAE